MIRGDGDALHQYFEENNLVRNITTLQLERGMGGGRRFVARQSLAFFSRELEVPGHMFAGRQFNSYTDLTYFHPLKKHSLVLGFNAENITDTRQGRFGTGVFPPHQNPTFAEIYTHTEGRVFNGGIKVRL